MSLMTMLATAKRVSITTGLYRPARWLNRRIRPHLLRALRNDIEFYRSLLSPGALCFDVGANIGDKSEALLQAGARVVAFEPNPLVTPELQARCGYHRDWTLWRPRSEVVQRSPLFMSASRTVRPALPSNGRAMYSPLTTCQWLPSILRFNALAAHLIARSTWRDGS